MFFPTLILIGLLFQEPGLERQKQPSSVPPGTEEKVLSASVPVRATITMERNRCYGTCPNYSLTITATGKVTYRGKNFVKSKGTRKARIPRNQVATWFSELERIGFFALKERYELVEDGCGSAVSDSPSITITVKSGRKSHTVTHFTGCKGIESLNLLVELENAIDEAVKVQRWVAPQPGLNK